MSERPISFGDADVRAILDGTKTSFVRPVEGGFDVSRCEFHHLESHHDPRIGTQAYFKEGGMLAGVKCPWGSIGDVLWVREFAAELGDETAYRADAEGTGGVLWTRASREQARLFIRLGAIRVTRLHESGETRERWGKAHRKQKFSWDANPWVWVVRFEKADGGDGDGLLPCPACGNAKHVFFYDYEEAGTSAVACGNCGARGRAGNGRRKAAKFWNAMPRELGWNKDAPDKIGLWLWRPNCRTTPALIDIRTVAGIPGGGEWVGPIRMRGQ